MTMVYQRVAKIRSEKARPAGNYNSHESPRVEAHIIVARLTMLT